MRKEELACMGGGAYYMSRTVPHAVIVIGLIFTLTCDAL